MYELTDKKLEILIKKITKLFNRYKATFDELNVISDTKKLYKELNKLNKETYLEIAKAYYEEIDPTHTISKKWLDEYLLGYNPTTKYVYEHEVERKRDRFMEALITVGILGKNKEFKTAFDLWLRQVIQYGISITDEARIEAYKTLGVKRMMWNTKQDEKVCKVCRERHKKIYPINAIPPKHYNCRCWLTPVFKKPVVEKPVVDKEDK